VRSSTKRAAQALSVGTSRSQPSAREVPEADRDLAALIGRDRLAVLGLALGYLGNPADAEDVAQDVFVKAYQELRAGRTAADLTRAWMLRVAMTTAIDRRRSAWWRRVVPTDQTPEVASRESTPEEQVVAESDRGAVLAAVQQLPLRLREVVVLYYFGDLTVGEVARVLRVSEAAVKTRLFRARDQLRPLLRESAPQSSEPMAGRTPRTR